MTAPTSKRKASLSLKERVRRAWDRKMRKSTQEAPYIEQPRVRLRGSEVEIESFRVLCGEGSHPIHFIRDGHTLKAILTPCGIAAARATWNLGEGKGESCHRIITQAQVFVGRVPPTGRPPSINAAVAGLTMDTTGIILRAVGDRPALEAIEKLRAARRKQRNYVAWDRTELTIAALPKIVAQAVGPGYEVWFHGYRCYIQAPGQTVPSCYVYNTGTWGVGPGPQGPDAAYHALRQWSKILGVHMNLAEKLGVAMQTPGFRPF